MNSCLVSVWMVLASLGKAQLSLSRLHFHTRLGLDRPKLILMQTGTLSGLLTLSDNLPKLDASFTGTVTKCHDTLRSLVSDPRELSQHARVNDRPAEEYVLPAGPGGSRIAAGGGLWRWDAGRWGSGRKVGEVLEALTTVSQRAITRSEWSLPGHTGSKDRLELIEFQEMTSIEQQQKQRTQSYNLAKGTLTNLQRKRTWVKPLLTV